MKKIYRIEEDKKIAGICAGFAHMFGIDITVIRLIFVFATLLVGIWPGIITYLAGWYLIPAVDKKDLGKEKNTSKTFAPKT